jgi:hypothetical protein
MVALARTWLLSASCGGAGTLTNDALVSPSALTESETEPAIATLPDDDRGEVLVAWMGYSADEIRVGYARSHDGGARFQAPAYLPSPPGQVTADPGVAFDSTGATYLSWLAIDGVPPDQSRRVYLARAEPGTDAFGPPVRIDAGERPFSDKPWLIVAPDDVVYLTWSEPERQMLAWSTDGAATFHAAVVAEGADFGHGRLCPDVTGTTVYVTYLANTDADDMESAHIQLRARNFDRAGAAFRPEATIFDPATAATAPVSASVDDCACLPVGSEVWIVYGTSSSTSPVAPGDEPLVSTALHVARWLDDANPPEDVVLAPGDAERGPRFLHPTMVRARAGGVEVNAYVSDGSLPADGATEAGTLRRWTMPPTWQASSPLPPGDDIALESMRFTAGWLGDYLGVARSAGGSLVAYVDNHTGTSHVAVRRTR